MKNVLKITGFLLVLVVVWYSVREKKQKDFKNNLPEIKNKESSVPSTLSNPKIFTKKLPRVPLTKSGDFTLNERHKSTLQFLYQSFFDTLQLLQYSISQIQNSSLPDLDAATVIQLHVFHKTQLVREADKREKAILMLGLMLRNSEESGYFVKEYLFEEDLWLRQMNNLHYVLMQEPGNSFLKQAFLTLLNPADAEQTLEYMQIVQYLDRGPSAEYFHVNLNVMERFDEHILRALVDKVDDYSWWAAYPERDAEQGLLEILGKKSR